MHLLILANRAIPRGRRFRVSGDDNGYPSNSRLSIDISFDETRTRIDREPNAKERLADNIGADGHRSLFPAGKLRT